MRILAFTDTHADRDILNQIKDKVKEKDPDLVICLGDFTIFGRDQKQILKKINSLGKLILLIHGNHEYFEDVEKDCSDLENIVLMHKRHIRIGNYLFLGWGGGGFSLKEKGFDELVNLCRAEKKKEDKIILLTHGPPFGTKLDRLYHGHCGSKSYSDFIRRFKPVLSLSGHLHENSGKRDRIGDTSLLNPGPQGKMIRI